MNSATAKQAEAWHGKIVHPQHIWAITDPRVKHRKLLTAPLQPESAKKTVRVFSWEGCGTH